MKSLIALIKLVWSHLPISIRWWVKKIYYGGKTRYCPICRSTVNEFLPAGVHDRRVDAKCPVCASIERHRLAWYFIQNHTDLCEGQPKRILHIAPEINLGRRFRRLKNIDYLSADLDSINAMVQMDITNIQYPDQSFDMIYCSHVLEHVPDDYKAISELYRVLRVGGQAILQVPIKGDFTFEDLSITSPQERVRLFGQEDHVRTYGSKDFPQRLCNVGFQVQEFKSTDIKNAKQVLEMQFKDENLYCCVR
jgi:SAM-dependent methyltransferase